MKLFFLSPLLVLAPALSAVADPVLVPAFSPHQRAPHAGIHIESVEVEQDGARTWVIVQIRNRSAVKARQGVVSVVAGHPLSSVFFNDLLPGALEDVRIPIDARTDGTELDVGVTMDPAFVAAGEVWDGVWHHVSPRYNNGNLTGFSDKAYTR